MFQNNLKIAWRGLLKNKVTGFINIGGLAIGMAVALLIALWVKDELTYNQYHKNHDQLAQVYLNLTFNGKTSTGQAVSQPFAPTFREDYGSNFEAISMASWQWEHLLSVDNQHFMESGMYVEPKFPEMLSLEMVHGARGEVLDHPNGIILCKSVADALFGTENPIGKTLKMDSAHDMEVTGVFEDIPVNNRFHSVKFYASWQSFLNQFGWAAQSRENWQNYSFQMFAQIKDNMEMEEVSAKIASIAKPHHPEPDPEVFLFPMSKWHLQSEFKEGVIVGGRIQYVRLFGITGIFVLILACINFMNLSTARSEKRAKEVGIRKTIGSMRRQLIGQFLSESILVAFIAMIFAVALVQIALPSFNELAAKEISIPHGSLGFWASLLGFTAFTGFLAGSYPAFYLSGFRPLKVLKGTFKGGQNATLPRKVLVTLQFTVSVALIIGTIVVFEQIQHAKNRPIGYEKDGVLQFMTNNELNGKYDVLKQEFMNTGVLSGVSHSAGPITDIWSNQSDLDWDGKDPNRTVSMGSMGISADFGKMVEWNILEGRDFSAEFSTDSSSFILNQAAAELLESDEVIGKTIRWGDTPFKVIGVIENMVMESPWNPIKPTFFYLSPNRVSFINLKLKPEIATQPALAALETVYKKHAPSNPFEYQFVDEEYGKKFAAEERIGKLSRIFAILAIFISCLGLFGLSAFVAEQRTKEIGIRKVLGASVADLWALQSKSFVVLVLLSCLIAIPIAWYYLSDWLTGYEYRVELNWTVFLWSALLALMVTLVTVSWQAIKAATANPVNSLKSE